MTEREHDMYAVPHQSPPDHMEPCWCVHKPGGRLKHIMLATTTEDFQRIKKFCEDEGLYLGRFVVRCAIRHIEEFERTQIQKRLKEIRDDA